MFVGLVTNMDSRGLATDARLLAGLLDSLGHQSEFIQYDKPYDKTSELLIFCEVVVPRFFSLSKAAPWLFVNPEFLFERDFKTIRTQFGKVLCKTKEAHRICSKHFGAKAVYTGFLSADKMRSDIARENRFLHIAGSSKVKGTRSVVDSWRWSHNGITLKMPLTIVSDWLDQEGDLPGMIDVVKDVSEEELTRLQNSHRFHLQPSGTEGFGHVLREAMSVNAVLLTTDAAPMNELDSIFTVPSESVSICREATVHEVSAIEIHKAARQMMTLPLNSVNARAEFLTANREFTERFEILLMELEPAEYRPMVKYTREFPEQKRVAFLGNFRHTFCTESDLAWSFEHIGHEVIRIQEDLATVTDLHSAVLDADMFIWVHTHGWNNLSDFEMHDFLAFLRKRSIPSASFHLDKYFGIPEREQRIGIDPFWKADFVFTADGGFQEHFWSRGVNHFWLPPGIVERAVHYGFPRTDLRCDVAFVGAGLGYHPCYPFREELIKFLHKNYAGRFKHFEGIRESGLNDVYASAKVVVGDSIFAGTPKYWSDRLPETAGRGGFLLFPRIEGMTIPCATYEPQNLSDLKEQIDRWLEQPVERRAITAACIEHVREHDTYRHRVNEILRVVLDGK